MEAAGAAGSYKWGAYSFGGMDPPRGDSPSALAKGSKEGGSLMTWPLRCR
jgi:hypothetical protein